MTKQPSGWTVILPDTSPQHAGIIPDANALWSRIVEAVPTANPASAITYIGPSEP